MKSIYDIVTGIKSIKGLPFILLALAAGIVFFILGTVNDEKPEPAPPAETEDGGYAKEIETRVGELLSGIAECTGASVMVTLESGIENVWARDENGSGGSEYVIIKNGGETAIPIKKLTPKIAGIAVVTGGAGTETKLEVTRLLSALLGLPTTKIYVW